MYLSMYLLAAALFVLSTLFYPASQEIGSVGIEACRYGSAFCQSPHFVLIGAVLAALWGSFVSVR